MFPALFAAGMSLIDTTDSVLMVGAYGWAFVKPMRKLYYNLTITLGVGGGRLADRRHRGAGPDRREASRSAAASGTPSAALNDNFSVLGFIIIGVFIAAWIGSILVYRYSGLDNVEVARSGD